ncbi:MAG: hypothetical protein ACK55Z_27320, partial [bacterium]
LCAGGGGSASSVLTKVLDYSDPQVSPARINETFTLFNDSNSVLDMTVWIKNNDADRSKQEIYGKLIYTKVKPTKDENISVGFYFGKNTKNADKSYSKPTKFEGSFATVGFKAADPSKSTFTSTMI